MCYDHVMCIFTFCRYSGRSIITKSKWKCFCLEFMRHISNHVRWNHICSVNKYQRLMSAYYRQYWGIQWFIREAMWRCQKSTGRYRMYRGDSGVDRGDTGVRKPWLCRAPPGRWNRKPKFDENDPGTSRFTGSNCKSDLHLRSSKNNDCNLKLHKDKVQLVCVRN